MRRITAALLGAVLLFPIIVAPVAAANASNCEQPVRGGGKAGETQNIPGTLSGVYARFDAHGGSAEPDLCFPGPDSFTATAFFIGFQDATGLGGSIIQIGMMRCADAGLIGYPFGLDPCEVGASWRFFWAYGGCNANQPWPRDLGAANPLVDTTFQIRWSAPSNVVKFFINGNQVASVSYQTAMGCWNTGEDLAIVACETFDLGDGCGGLDTNPLDFDSFQYRLTTSDTTWYAGGLVGPGFTETSRYKRAVYDSAVLLWTVQP